MANRVTVQVVGGQQKTVDNVSTISQLKEMFNVPNHTATINGEPATSSSALGDYNFVHLAPAVKGGR